MIEHIRTRSSVLLAAIITATIMSPASSFAFSANCVGLLRRGTSTVSRQAVSARTCLPPSGLRLGRAFTCPGRGQEHGSLAAGLRMQEDSKDQGKAGGKSVLVISWFYAEPKQIELVKRIYQKKGFKDVVVHESPVKATATPRGWYKTFIGHVKSMDKIQAEGMLARKFDVVHCMSGGFLNLYLILSAKIPVQFDHLVMDSTPIMPKPAAFVRFARAYMNDNGLKAVTKILPEPVHTGYQSLRWSIGALYVRFKHKTFIKKELRSLDKEKFEFSNDWSRWAAGSSAKMDYKSIVDDAISTVFNRPGLKVAFIYNDKDSYLNPADVKYVIQKCKEFGVDTTEVLTETKHIETIFRKPNILFGAIDAMMESKATA